MTKPVFFDVAVDGGALRVARWGTGDDVVLGLHGITASSMSLAPIARAIAPRSMVAPDLRGRGGSAELPGPFGMRVHADDCAAVIRAVAPGPVTVVGESMGAFVAVALAAKHPDLVSELVLVDGGLPLAVPDGVDPDAILDAMLGPAIDRLRRSFTSVDDYLDYWRPHPALSECWGPDVEAYLTYDLGGAPPELRSRVREAAVRGDGADTVTNAAQLRDALGRVRCPVHLLRATRNVMNAEPALLPDPVVEPWRDVLTADVVVDDTNHYSIMFGERGVAAVAAIATRR